MKITVEDEVILIGSWEKIAAGNGLGASNLGKVTTLGKSSPAETVMVVAGGLDGKVRADGRGFNANGPLFDASGGQVGNLVISWETLAQSKEDLLTSPTPPVVSLDERGPLPRSTPLTLAQAKFTLNDGSTLTAVGSGFSRLVPSVGLIDDVVTLRVSQGTGQFAGKSGLISVSGSVATHGQEFFGNAGAQATQHVVATIRLS